MTLTLLLACQKKGMDVLAEWPWEEEEETPATDENAPSDATLDKWTDVSTDFGALPEYIKVYRSPENLEGKKAVAYIAIADMVSAQWDVWSISDPEMDGTDDKFKTPQEVYKGGTWPIIINAGFFYASGGKNYSSSLAVRDSDH